MSVVSFPSSRSWLQVAAWLFTWLLCLISLSPELRSVLPPHVNLVSGGRWSCRQPVLPARTAPLPDNGHIQTQLCFQLLKSGAGCLPETLIFELLFPLFFPSPSLLFVQFRTELWVVWVLESEYVGPSLGIDRELEPEQCYFRAGKGGRGWEGRQRGEAGSSSLRSLQQLCALHGCGAEDHLFILSPCLLRTLLPLNCLVFIKPANLWPVSIFSWEIVAVVKLSMCVIE